MKKLEISDIKIEKPDYQTGLKPKDKITLEWLILWVKTALSKNEISYGDILPPKKELAAFLGISTGTLQNAIRCAEDMGYFVSKQCVGTSVKNPDECDHFDKMISKKDKAVIEIKKYICKNKLSIGNALPSAREISNKIKTSQNTVRLALEYLVQTKILKHKVNHGNKSCYEYFNSFEMNEDEVNIVSKITAEPLYKKIKEKIKLYLTKNYKTGDKISPNEFFAKKYNVSIRTINDAMKELNKEKIILSRRGRYGTTYLNEPAKALKQKETGEKSMFMSNPKGQSVIKNSYLYNWERIVDQLKKYMIVNHEAGDKIPSMKELASILNVSSNTVRKAVSELVKDGILFTQRGKYGGVYIVEMPAKEDAFTWLALNPKFILKDTN